MSLYDLNKDMLIQLILKMETVSELSKKELLRKKIIIDIELNNRRIIERIKNKIIQDEKYTELINKIMKHIDIISQIKNVEYFHYQYEYCFNLFDEDLGELYYIEELRDINRQHFDEMMKNYKDFYLSLDVKYVRYLIKNKILKLIFR
jgi:hypothetical protein